MLAGLAAGLAVIVVTLQQLELLAAALSAGDPAAPARVAAICTRLLPATLALVATGVALFSTVQAPARDAHWTRPALMAARQEHEAAILAVIARIPRGRVTTYGSVAARAGLARRARLVGKVLGTLPADSALPWHRVVAAAGRVALPEGSASRRRQLERLLDEGVLVVRGRIDLARYGWSTATDLDQLLWGRDE